MLFNNQILWSIIPNESRGGKFVWNKNANRNTRSTVLNGNKILNPYKGIGYSFAADLFEYRLDGEGYLLKTYKVIGGAGTSLEFDGTGWSHIPEIGDKLMVAPANATDTGDTATVTAVTFDKTAKKFTVTFDNNLFSANVDDILVEAADDDTPLVKNPNTFIETNILFNIPSDGSYGFTEFAGYLTTAYGLEAFIERMQPLPPYVLAKNKSYIEGIFEL